MMNVSNEEGNIMYYLPAPSQQDYDSFLQDKRPAPVLSGFEVNPDDINPKLFPFQRDIVRWALRLGKAAMFEECGLGKTAQQLEWARHVHQYTGKPVLILAPLAVADQTMREAGKFGIQATVKYCRDASEMDGIDIVITNYERIEKFNPAAFGGVVLDESSILKNLGGVTFWKLVRSFENTPFRLACTATPAPNDHVELTNHSHLLGIMNFKEVMARYFTAMKDGIARTSMLKPHGEADFWRWLTSWAASEPLPAPIQASWSARRCCWQASMTARRQFNRSGIFSPRPASTSPTWPFHIARLLFQVCMARTRLASPVPTRSWRRRESK
jgi:hypothetical protein